ncbi:GAF domain-containing protein [Amycolatopsis rhabdoformis]|uniref:GAF domain-containing protein n=1 Tax=Amycolatopsis rhabdoformis TaxID=1448059 RepID=A0ABZ1I2D2_9PSEU|nr:GAF domain-containing protein [Amycolatopsis rhabdoformis]WSE27962.1 GAF domain-containing protein [Amycolatopsis rhabdoformis]
MDTNGGVTTTERDLARLLHLLADETGATGEFDRLGEDLAGEGDGELVALTLTRAARIRGLLADRKRREREMQALLDTASDLASVHEVDAALDAIVARARRLLGTDAAYMALVDPETGDAFMRVTLGTITRPIESLRQPAGYGVGGWVAQEGRPFATANYLRDDRIRRKHSVASAVAEDGIVSILGVPMRVGSEVIGVLFGANRDERTFAQSEIDLLHSLADHAAIVLENARLFAATKATAEELTAANDQLARHNKALEQASTAHEQLMAMVLRRADLAELVDAVAATLDGAVLAAEPDGTPLAKAGPAELVDRLPELWGLRADESCHAPAAPRVAAEVDIASSADAEFSDLASGGPTEVHRDARRPAAAGDEAGGEALANDRRDRRRQESDAVEEDRAKTPPAGETEGLLGQRPRLQHEEPEPGRARDLGRRAWTVPVRAGAEVFGHLVFAGRVEPLDTDKRILERSAQTAALLLLVERQMSAAEQQVRGQVVEELLAEREPDWVALRRRAKVSGVIDFAVRQTVLVVSATGTTRRRLLRAAADYVRAHGGVATEHGGHAVLVLPCGDAEAAVKAARRHLERATGGTVTAGVAGPAATAPAVRSLHREAERCHRLLVALGRAGTAASLADLGVLGLVLDGASREHVRRLVDDNAGPILCYDNEHGSLLAETLDGYFAAGENPRAAARRLQVHANTVYQRLDRVDQVLGHRRWREPAGALTLRIALQLRRVLDQIPVVP